MIYELVVDGTDISTHQIKNLQKAVEHEQVSKLIVPSGYLDAVKIKKNVGAIIDFPYGISETVLREKEIERAAQNNIKFIDLVISQRWMIDRNTEKIQDDFNRCNLMCMKHGLEMRCLIEYRLIPENLVIEISKILHNAGLDKLILGGTIQDNTTDLILLCQDITKNTNLDLIVGASNLDDKLTLALSKVGVTGIRKRLVNIFY